MAKHPDITKQLVHMGLGDILQDLRDGSNNSPSNITIPITPLERAYNSIITGDDETISTKNWARSLSSENINVLITGETGTGKELFAELLHGNKRGKFVTVNCGGIPDTLLEAEFFGAERGAYTGCEKSRAGFFEEAKDGTIFLDEIGELDRSLQSKLLRVIQSRKVRRIGSVNEIDINCRIVSATNIPAETLRDNNKLFRIDLYYRLAGTTINLKPLRERGYDAQLIWNKMLEGCQSIAMTGSNYPGNIRELLNTIAEIKLKLKYNNSGQY